MLCHNLILFNGKIRITEYLSLWFASVQKLGTYLSEGTTGHLSLWFVMDIFPRGNNMPSLPKDHHLYKEKHQNLVGNMGDGCTKGLNSDLLPLGLC